MWHSDGGNKLQCHGRTQKEGPSSQDQPGSRNISPGHEEGGRTFQAAELEHHMMEELL